jgi:peptide/nickel transport system substrate-binding protein
MMKRLALLLALVLVVSTFGAGSVSATHEEGSANLAPQQDDVSRIVIGTTDDISELDPANAYSFHDWEILRNTSEGLLAYVPGSTDIEPRLATDFPTVSEDGLTYTFTLRDDAMFPDGTALTAETMVEWANRSLTLQGDPYTLISIVDTVTLGENENEIVFTLKERFDLFPITVASQPQLYPFQAGDFPADDFDNQPDQIRGVGPYMLVDYTIGEQAVFQANPNYYGEAPAFDEVVFVYYEDDAQLTLAIETGEIDMAWRGVTETEVDRLAGIENLELITVPGRIQYFLFNHDSEIGGNKLVRTAIAKAINRDEIVDRGLSGLATPIFSMVPPGFAGASESFFFFYGNQDLEGAIADLQEAGYSEDSPLQLDLWYPPERYGGQVADAMIVVESQLEATGLIDVELQSVEWSTYVTAATAGEYPFYFLGWFFDYPDADNYIQPFASCDGSPGLGVNYCNETMEELISNQRSLVGSPDREEALIAMQDFYAEDVVGIPLWVGQDHMVYNSNVVTNVLVGAPLVLEYRLLQSAE